MHPTRPWTMVACAPQTCGRARHGHCRNDRRDLIKPPSHQIVQFSRQLSTDVICPCRALPQCLWSRRLTYYRTWLVRSG
eukprot:8175130-Pyramimonas_sp.AAC.1